MAISSAALVPRIRDLLNDYPWETTSTTTDTAGVVAVPDGTRWAEGNIGEWQTGTIGFEKFRVISVSANNLTVSRGFAGTTAETHTSGDRIVKNPLYGGREIQQAATARINEMWPYVWKTGSVTLTPSTTEPWYDLHALTLGIVRATQLYGDGDILVGVFGDRFYGGGKYYVVQRNLPTGLVASTNGIRFPAGIYHATNSINVIDQRAVTGSSDIEDSATLPVADALIHGVLGRLLGAKEIGRVSHGENADVAGSVGVGSRVQLAAYYDQLFWKKIASIQIKLQRIYQPDKVWSV
jgi:hypothetical protein